ncbi:MAG: hypothetical protein LRS43_04295 [Desulfurococcales archaeon]|nr:hypothetical protein [Desulfurococcales archaeon]
MISGRDLSMVEKAVGIVEKASSKGVTLRLLGALAVFVRVRDCSECLEAMVSLERLGTGSLFTDIDLAGYSKQRKHIRRFFEEELGFEPDFYVNRLFGDRRLIFQDPRDGVKVDVFLDKLEFSHDVVLKGRLEMDYPTIALDDLILEKLQIHEINWKDLVDLAVLFARYDVCREPSRDCINGKRIASILADDWGFWYDAMSNLERLERLLEKSVASGRVSGSLASRVSDRVARLKTMISEEPKTKKWVKRSKIGTSKPWYRRVEEVSR